MNSCYDVFLCYRHADAQTPKLMKRHWDLKGWPGALWYSNGQAYGNYKTDIPALISNAEAAVIFLSDQFTQGFLSILREESRDDCITVHEVLAIVRRKLADDSFRILTVNLDGYTLNTGDVDILRQVLAFSGLPEDSVSLFTQCNQNRFDRFRDYESELFERIFHELFRDEYYRRHLTGTFCFGDIPTSVDLIAWDKHGKLLPENVHFDTYAPEISFYQRLQSKRMAQSSALQNDDMLSVVRCPAEYKADGVLEITVEYKTIEYRLFEKGIFLRQDGGLRIHQKVYAYRNAESVFPVPNAMGMAIMVVTADRKLIFSRRSAQRGVRPLEYDCSIVEGMKFESTWDQDGEMKTYSIADPDYLLQEFRRAYREEICPDDTDLEIHINGVILDKEYAQWNFVGTIVTQKTQAALLRQEAARDDPNEKRVLFFVPYVDDRGSPSLEPIAQALALYRSHAFWSTGLAALYSALLHLGFKDQEIFAYPWTNPKEP